MRRLFTGLRHVMCGILAVVCEMLSTLLVSSLLVIFSLLYRFIPVPLLRKACRAGIEKTAIMWTIHDHWILHTLLDIDWKKHGTDCIDPSKNYLVIANHRSWADIPVLEEALYGKTGGSRYFIKKALLNIPIMGWSFKAMNFPAMHRFSKSMLLKNPHLKGKDTEITRDSCARLKDIHFKLINFTEGTRFTPEKHQRQQSPYQYLLKPKAGGISFAMHALHDQVDGILNLTIAYDRPMNFWSLYFSRIRTVTMHVEKIAITPDLLGDYENDRTFRVYFQAWLNDVWHKKDRLIQSYLDQA